ncbi:MAG: hypothetical protein QOE35_70 [Actinomycetota bacterium]|jgi:hypothetical protein
MRIRFLVAAAAAAIVVGMMPSPAFAADGSGGSSIISATLTSNTIGSRSVSLVTTPAMTSALNSSTLSTGYTVTVLEAARTGTNPWKAQVSVNQLTSTLTPGTPIPVASLNLAPGAMTLTTAGTGSDAPGVGGAFVGSTADPTVSDAQDLWTNTGQLPGSIYTGTHTGAGTLTLTPPNATKLGVYTGTFTVTLFQ